MSNINSKFNGPLRKNPINPRYFTDSSGKAIYLTGSHTWFSMQDMWLEEDGKSIFDYNEFLDMMEGYGHNFLRFWQYALHTRYAPWTEEKIIFDPLPYARTGKGLANDGEPKFDLDKWNEDYFTRLRERVEEAGRRGIYVSVMLFEGWCIQWSRESVKTWPYHPYNKDNNVNGVDGDPDKDGKNVFHTMEASKAVQYQKAFIRKVIDTLNDLDFILYEISNEIPLNDQATLWHYSMVDYVKEYEKSKPVQHPVGMTAQGFTQTFDLETLSNADWISPGSGRYFENRYNPPASKGERVILFDTDHIYAFGGSPRWVWMSLTRGLNPLFMDSWGPVPCKKPLEGMLDLDLNSRYYPGWEPIRINLGYARKYADRMDLNRALPHNELCTTSFCLANPGREYLIFAPGGGPIGVDLYAYSKTYKVEWFDPDSGKAYDGGLVKGGHIWGCELKPPFSGDAVLYMAEHTED